MFVFYFNGWSESFCTKWLYIFGLLESISDESKTMGQHQNFVLFPNMCLEILYLFLVESSDGILERPKKLVWKKNFFVHFRIFTIGIRNEKLKLLLIYHFVKKCSLYKITDSDNFQHLRKETYGGQQNPVYSPSKPFFQAFPRFHHYSRSKTDTKFLSTYSERAQNSGANPQFLTHLKYFQAGQKCTSILCRNFRTTRYKATIENKNFLHL